jgi:hypothetical protein
VTAELRGLLIGEVFVTLFVLAGIYANRAVTWWLFQIRRRANLGLGGAEASSDPATAQGALGTSAWQEFINDVDFLRANGISPSELEALKHASFMGDVTCKDDIVYILNAIRRPAHRS